MPADEASSAPEPTFKRRRVALACKTCRNRKTRCNGTRPACMSCVELGLVCQYEPPSEPHLYRDPGEHGNNENPGGRDAPFTQRLDTIESALRLLIQNSLINNNNTVSDDNMLGKLTAVLPSSSVDGSSHNDNTALDHDDPSSGEDNVDGMASVYASVGSDTRLGRSYGPSSNIAFLDTIAHAAREILRSPKTPEKVRSVAELDPSSARSFFVPSQPVQSNYTRTPGSGISLPNTSDNACALPSPAAMSRMLDAFFSDTALLFPFVYEETVRSHASLAAGRVPVSAAALGLLNAVFAMAVSLDESGLSAGETSSSMEQRQRSEETAELYCARAKRLLASTRHPSIERIQCLLLLCQYRQGTQRAAEDTCTLHAQAVRLATQMGLHVPSAREGISHLEREVHNRTWLNCIMLDRILSMTFGCQPLISDDSIANIQDVLPQSLESIAGEGIGVIPNGSHQVSSAQGAASAGCFGATCKLYTCVDDIITRLYGANINAKGDSVPLSQILEATLALDFKLAAWQDDLPLHLRKQPWLDEVEAFDDTELLCGKLSTVLHLRYLSICILRDRPTLEYFLKPWTRSAPNLSLVSEAHLVMAKVVLARIEHQAAQAIEIIWRLRDRPHALGAWWFSAYYLLNSSLALFACLLLRAFILPRAQSGFVHIAFTRNFQDIATTMKRGEEAASAVLKRTDRAKHQQQTLRMLVERAWSIISVLPPHDGNEDPQMLFNDQIAGVGDAGAGRPLEWLHHPRASFSGETTADFLDRSLFAGLDGLDAISFDDLGTF